MIQLVTPPDGQPYASVRMVLTGSEFQLSWAYNTRTDSWTLSIYRAQPDDTDLTPVMVGALVCMGRDLLARCQHPQRPDGTIYVVSTDGVHDVDLDDLSGGRVRVLYFEPGEAIAA